LVFSNTKSNRSGIKRTGPASNLNDHLCMIDLINHQHAIGEEKVTEGADHIFLIDRFEVFLR